MDLSKKRIFWLEDDAEDLSDYLAVLIKTYDVEMGASEDLVYQKRRAVDLVILDLMIHETSRDGTAQREVKNIIYSDRHWTRTGLEFLCKLRAGAYEEYGFPEYVPVIVATAITEVQAREAVAQVTRTIYIEKPFTVARLRTKIQEMLQP